MCEGVGTKQREVGRRVCEGVRTGLGEAGRRVCEGVRTEQREAGWCMKVLGQSRERLGEGCVKA